MANRDTRYDTRYIRKGGRYDTQYIRIKPLTQENHQSGLMYSVDRWLNQWPFQTHITAVVVSIIGICLVYITPDEFAGISLSFVIGALSGTILNLLYKTTKIKA